MIRYFILTAFRSLWNNKVHTFINISGLALGLLSTTLIALWVQSELRYDRFYSHSDRLYQVYTCDTFDGQRHAWGGTPAILGPRLQDERAEIENMSRTSNLYATLGEKDARFNTSGMAVDSAFFHMFDFTFIQGNSHQLLEDPHHIIITESLSERLFGTGNALGQKIQLDTVNRMEVTGVIQDIPYNSRFSQQEFFTSWSFAENRHTIFYQSWTSYNHQTYVLLKPGVSQADMDRKIADFVPHQTQGETRANIFLHPASKWHLYDKSENGQMLPGRLTTLRVFMLAGGFILVIACINFINLSTARSEKRAREIGVRKVIGAGKPSLIVQFIGESLMLALIAGLLAFLALLLVLPAFNQLIREELSLGLVPLWFWLGYGVLTLFTGLAAGVYPAFMLASYKPVDTLKATLSKGGKTGLTPRKVLVVVQFSISIFLTICTLVIARQIQHGENRDVGYNKDQLIYASFSGDLSRNYKAAKQALLNSDAAISVSANQGPISRHSSNSWGFSWPGSRPEDYDVVFETMSADADFTKTMGIKLIAGRDMDVTRFPSDSSAILINEAAAKRMGLVDPLGAIITQLPGDPNARNWKIVGVFQDYIYASPYDKVEPMIVFGPSPYSWFNYMHIRMNPAHAVSDNLAKIQAIIKEYNPNYPFDYHFADADYARKFAKEQQTARLTGLFSALAIFIGSLGLLGLITYTIQQRSKELGIRKVLGASLGNILNLLTFDLLLLVGIAIGIAGPVSWWVMQQWLDRFAYRVDIAWWIILAGGALGIGIAFFSIVFQALRAARANPVDALRDE